MLQILRLVTNRTTLIIILLAAVALLFGWGYLERSGRIEAQNEREEAISLANHHKEATVFYVNKYNQEVAKTRQVKISPDNFKKLQGTKELKFTKSFNVKPKQIMEAAQISGHIDFSSSGTLTGISQDSLIKLGFTMGGSMHESEQVICDKVFLWKIKDEYNDIEAMVIDTPRFKMRLPIDLVVTWERKRPMLWLLSKKRYFFQVTSPNKQFKTDSVSSFSIRKK